MEKVIEGNREENEIWEWMPGQLKSGDPAPINLPNPNFLIDCTIGFCLREMRSAFFGGCAPLIFHGVFHFGINFQ
jgi:hypothetical protein